jgi:hypothetical protein
MKMAILALIAGLSFSVKAAELKFFENYNPVTLAHGKTYYSTSENPLSGDSLIVGTTTGACYIGRPEDVEKLIEKMLAISKQNGVQYKDLMLGHFINQTAKPIFLQFTLLGKDENQIVTWPRIRPCGG